MTDVVKLLENLFEDERGMKNVRQGDVDTARDRVRNPAHDTHDTMPD
jgi:hypothetical protein